MIITIKHLTMAQQIQLIIVRYWQYWYGSNLATPRKLDSEYKPNDQITSNNPTICINI